MRTLLSSCALALLAPAWVFAEVPVGLEAVAAHQFHGQKNLPHRVRVQVPYRRGNPGIERFSFHFQSEKSGPVESPEIRIAMGEQRFLVPVTDFFVFDEPPKSAAYHVAHAAHPSRPNLVVIRLYCRDQHKARINLSRTRFGPTPPGIEVRWINVRSAGPGLYAMTFSVENQSDEPFTVTGTNFENLSKEYRVPPVIVPPPR